MAGSVFNFHNLKKVWNLVLKLLNTVLPNHTKENIIVKIEYWCSNPAKESISEKLFLQLLLIHPQKHGWLQCNLVQLYVI